MQKRWGLWLLIKSYNRKNGNWSRAPKLGPAQPAGCHSGKAGAVGLLPCIPSPGLLHSVLSLSLCPHLSPMQGVLSPGVTLCSSPLSALQVYPSNSGDDYSRDPAGYTPSKPPSTVYPGAFYMAGEQLRHGVANGRDCNTLVQGWSSPVPCRVQWGWMQSLLRLWDAYQHP